MSRKCIGCGAILQSDNPDNIGYVIKSKIDVANYCERCFRLINYGEFKNVISDNDKYLQIYKDINNTDDLVLYLADIFNLNDSINLINEHITNKIILVITKYDIIPKSVKESKIKENINQFNFNKNIIDIVFVSSKTNYNIDLLYNKIYQYKTSNNVYVVGNSNSGKSSLINRFIKNYSNENLQITTSILPSTTINTNQIFISKDLILIDTPGFIENDNISNFVSAKDLKRIMPSKEIKPITYQIIEGTSLLIDKLLRIEYVKGEKNSFTFYLSNDIIISRINTMTNERGKELYMHLIEVLPNEDVIVNGLCFIKVTKKALLKIYTINGVGVYKRKSLI